MNSKKLKLADQIFSRLSKNRLLMLAAIIAVFIFVLIGCWLTVMNWKYGLGWFTAGLMLAWFCYDIKIGLWCLLVSLLFGQILRIPLGDGGLLVSDGVIVVLATAWVIYLLTKKISFKTNILWWSLLAFWLVGFMINAWEIGQYDYQQNVTIWLYWFRLFFYTWSLPISWSIVNKEKNKIRYMNWFVVIGFIFLFLGFVQLKIVPDISFLTEGGWDPHQGRLLSTFLDPNFAGAWLILLFAIAYARYLYYKGWDTNKVLWMFLSGCFLLGIVLTLSRSAYVAAAIVFVVLSYMRDKRLLFLGFFVGLLLLVSNERISQRVQGIFKVDETAQLRIKSWEQNFDIVQDNFWTGVGYNALGYEQLRRGIVKDLSVHSAGGSDSSYVTIWSTLGWIGLFCWLLIYVVFFAIAVKGYIREKENIQKGLLIGIVAGIFGVMIHAQFTNSLLYPHILIPVLFLMGWVMGTMNLKKV